MNSVASQLFKRLKLIDEEDVSRLVEKHLREYDPALKSLASIHQEMQSVLNRSDLIPEEKLALFKMNQQRFGSIKVPQADLDIGPITMQDLPNNPVAVPPPVPPPAPPAPPIPHGLPPPVRVGRHRIPQVNPGKTVAHHEKGPAGDVDDGIKTGAAAAAAEEQMGADQSADGSVSEKSARNLSLAKLLEFLPNVQKKDVKRRDQLANLIDRNPEMISLDRSSGEIILEGKKIKNSSFSDIVHSLYESKRKKELPGQLEFIKVIAKIYKGDLDWKLNLKPEHLIGNRDFVRFFKEQLGSGARKLGKNKKPTRFSRKISTKPPGKGVKVLYLY